MICAIVGYLEQTDSGLAISYSGCGGYVPAPGGRDTGHGTRPATLHDVCQLFIATGFAICTTRLTGFGVPDSGLLNMATVSSAT